MSALVGRTAALHAACWHYDRWYRFAWFAWPQALALLIAGWLFAEHAPLSVGQWAKPADCAGAANPGCAATQRVVFVFPDVLINPTIAVEGTIPVDRTAFRSSAPADQPKLTAALAAYYRSDWHAALNVLNSAVAGDPNVQLLRGLALLGQFTVDSVRQAQTALQSAAAAGQRQAAVALGRMLIMGPLGLPKDEPQGRKLIEDAAAAGEPYALRLAGVGRLSGEFGRRDPAKAAELMRRSAEAGDPFAMIQFAQFLQSGIGVASDQEKSVDYLRRAADAGATGAQFLLGEWVANRYKNREIDDPSESVKWYERAYQRGYSFYALVNLAYDYKVARSPPWFDTARSFALLQLCAPYRFVYCHYQLGLAYQSGAGTAQDAVKAYAYHTVARQLGSQDAAAMLQRLDTMVSPAVKSAGTELAGKLDASLKPVPPQLSLQMPEAVAGPSPWAQPPSGAVAGSTPGQTPSSSAPAAQPSSAAAADWAACKGDKADLALAACARLIGSGLADADLGVAHYFKGWNEYREGRYEEAASDYGEAIRRGAMLAYAQNGRGAAYLALGKVDAAFRDFDEAIRADASFALAYANRGYVYLRQNQPEKAIADASAAIRLDPKLARAYWVRAGGHELKGEWAQVVADCTTALGSAPQYTACYDRRGFAYAKMGRSDLALADYDASLRLAPRSLWTLLARAHLRRQKQMLELAIDDYSEAIRQQPNSVEAYANRAEARLMNKQYELALADAAKAIEIDRRSALAYGVRGRAEMELGRLDEAGTDFAFAVDLAPKDSHLRFFSAVAAAKLDEQAYSRCAKRNGGGREAGRPTAGAEPAMCTTGLDYAMTLRELSEAIRLDPQYSDAYAYRGQIYLLVRQRERGIADLREALRINPQNDYARNALRSLNVSP